MSLVSGVQETKSPRDKSLVHHGEVLNLNIGSVGILLAI